ncbi:ATP-binding protein [Merismopedia glauca]|uniref:ATPase domain-containing protein n=1 Tax=Merismopedia glauca CCAP 1448/3 TaxID=1296344 RepID=A0A2T1C520_9CYAN|nr:ATP-binding protein [Merismopedia glauca]PSB03258.1 ATPase domain-containing protein [Merismopedia glauca CCAP 1448/3]
MTVNEVLHFVDNLVYEKTGKRLDDVQKAVVEGTWQRETYKQIAEKCHVSKNHVGDVGYQLWQVLSERLGEDINKQNFCSIIERLFLAPLPIIIQNNNKQNNNHNFNFGSQTLGKNNYEEQKSYEDNQKNKLSNYDLTLAPKIIRFYNRETEIKTLSNWILSQNSRLISVLGLRGIGKTTLVKRFVDLNLHEFEIVIWRSLKFPKSLNLLLDDLLSFCNISIKESTDDKLRQLLNLIVEKKCLIILDDVHNLFVSGQLAGQYQTQYKDYQNLFQAIAESEHQSHFILISQEQCSEIHCLDQELYPVKCLELSGMDNAEILKTKGLQDEDRWLELIQLYEGIPAYLQDIAALTKDIFDGKVAELLMETKVVITANMQYYFRQLFERLSIVEQQIVKEFSKRDRPISRADLSQKLDLSSTDFINGLQSLQQRYLVRKINDEKNLFNLSPVFKEYVKNSWQL